MKVSVIFTSLAAILSAMAGCVSTGDIDEGFRRIDRLWQLDYQKTEDEFRYRVVDADYATVFREVKKTFNDLGMPVDDSSIEDGIVLALADAPKPLTSSEWKKVVEYERPRVKEAAGWMFKLQDDPKGYVVKWSAAMKPIQGRTFVLLDYRLDMPKYREVGITANQYAPALAVQLASLKFWTTLEKRLSEGNLPGPRQRTEAEKLMTKNSERGTAIYSVAAQ